MALASSRLSCVLCPSSECVVHRRVTVVSAAAAAVTCRIADNKKVEMATRIRSAAADDINVKKTKKNRDNNGRRRRRYRCYCRSFNVTTCWLLLMLFFSFALFSNLQCTDAISNTLIGFSYEAPSDCQWSLMNSSDSSSVSLSSSSSSGGGGGVGGSGGIISGTVEVSLHCRLRTINSQFDQTNFSVVPREHTTALTIECSDSLLYQRFVPT